MAGKKEVLAPKPLYEVCLLAVSDNFRALRKECKQLPTHILFDVYYQLYQENCLCILGGELSSIFTFDSIVKLTHQRLIFYKIFQGLEEHGAGLGKRLTYCYVKSAEQYTAFSSYEEMENFVFIGLRLGCFLNDTAWYDKAEIVLTATRNLCDRLKPSPYQCLLALHCSHNLLQAQSSFCNFKLAGQTRQNCQRILTDLQQLHKVKLNLAVIYSNYSTYYLIKSNYDKCYKYSILALNELTSSVPVRTVVDVLRQAAKSCVVKREFARASILIKQAVNLARNALGENHPIYAEALFDFAFFLLNFDCIRESVRIYKAGYMIKKHAFGERNIHVALAYEELAYALYVYEYSSGSFDLAKAYADKAIELMESLLPCDHIKLASAKRVKALILEEIAIDNPDNITGSQLLLDAEKLHLAAVDLSKKAFGEMSVQTAKHYGNLGRLYQSMKRYIEAEMMHLRAISIKEELLGKFDYEVGLSVGHLASLYNYHMDKPDEAERLYLRSIDISLKLFGEKYSGLEYDYRGLFHVYKELKKDDKMAEYRQILAAWRVLRDEELDTSSNSRADVQEPPLPISKIIEQVMRCELTTSSINS